MNEEPPDESVEGLVQQPATPVPDGPIGLRVGFVFRVFTPPVLAGFVAGAAVVIATSQVGALLDVSLERGLAPVAAWGTLVLGIGDTNRTSALLGSIILAGLLGLPEPMRRALRVGQADGTWRGHLVRALPLVLILGAAVATQLLGLEDVGVATLGTVHLPSLVPTVAFPTGLQWAQMAGSTMVISMVAAVTTLAIAQDLARHNGDEVSTNNELFSLGTSSIFVSMFGGYPIGGSLSRSAVVADSGGRSPLAAAVGATILLAVAALAGDLLGAIPRTALAALIMAAAITMLKPREFAQVWRRDRPTAATMAVPFVIVVGFGPAMGLLAAAMAGGAHLWLNRRHTVARDG